MLPPMLTVRKYLEDAALLKLERKMGECLEDPNRLLECEGLHEQYDLLGRYCRLPVEKILKGLKLASTFLDLPMSKLSDSEKVCVALTKAIAQNPDILLLDEPTNHLDLLALEAFEVALLSFKGLIVALSHDLTFKSKFQGKEIRLQSG